MFLKKYFYLLLITFSLTISVLQAATPVYFKDYVWVNIDGKECYVYALLRVEDGDAEVIEVLKLRKSAKLCLIQEGLFHLKVRFR